MATATKSPLPLPIVLTPTPTPTRSRDGGPCVSQPRDTSELEGHLKCVQRGVNVDHKEIYHSFTREFMMSAANTFDFAAYLGRIDPAQRYAVHRLTGGVVNVTVRARKLDTIAGGRFPGHESIVIKYAPPYIAGVGEEAAMSQQRQVCIPNQLRPRATNLPRDRRSKREVCLCSTAPP